MADKRVWRYAGKLSVGLLHWY